MGVVCWLLGVTPAQIGAVRATPSLASDMARVTTDAYFAERRAAAWARMPPGVREASEADYRAALERLPGAVDAKSRIAEARGRLERTGPLGQPLALEKSWHILHYLFTGRVDEANGPGNFLLTGEVLGDNVGYGPVRLHDQREVRDFAHFLDAQDEARVVDRVRYQEMARLGVYSAPTGPGSDAEDEDQLRSAVAFHFPRLRDYAAEAARKQDGLLIWLS